MMNKNLLKQAQQMQARLAKVQDEVAEMRTEASAGGGVVKVVTVGTSSIESIEINPEVVDAADVELLQDLIMAAVNEALESAQKTAQDKMSAVTGGMNIPGLG
ncbi:MAG: YbaB/EbfC family nucleoid-associated protein [Dehalococcoidia bacterium]